MRIIFKKLKNGKFPCIHIKNDEEFLRFRKYCLELIEHKLLFTSIETLDISYYEHQYNVFTVYEEYLKKGKFVELKYGINPYFEIHSFHFLFKDKFVMIDETQNNADVYFKSSLLNYYNQTNHFYREVDTTCA